MLEHYLNGFLNHCREAHFALRSESVMANRVREFEGYLESLGVGCITDVTYIHLSGYVTFNHPSVHIKKSRVWTLHQFFHYLKLQGLFKENIALKIPYPKIEQKDPRFLSSAELSRVISHFIGRAETPDGLRDLVTVLFFAFLGLRISSVIALNIQDIDLPHSRARFIGKGNKVRCLPLPQILCRFLNTYMNSLGMELGPLFQSNRGRRISCRTVQNLFAAASRDLGFHLHSHLFRHTAATEMNRVAGIDLTKQLLGHRRRENTRVYVHLNPDVYAEYMRHHPIMSGPRKES